MNFGWIKLDEDREPNMNMLLKIDKMDEKFTPEIAQPFSA